MGRKFEIKILYSCILVMSQITLATSRESDLGVSDQVSHKLGGATTEDGKMLGILYLESRGIALSV